MAIRKIKKEDEVVVITGKDKGRRGKVLRVMGDDRVIVEGVNVAKKHVKPNPNRGIKGGIVEKEKSIHVSNVALYNPVSKKADRVGIRILDNGQKVRYFKSNNEMVEV